MSEEGGGREGGREGGLAPLVEAGDQVWLGLSACTSMLRVYSCRSDVMLRSSTTTSPPPPPSRPCGPGG